MMSDQRLVILDRDGVINEDSDAYIKSVEEWKPISGSLDAIAQLSQAGFLIAVVTNQSGLARGLFDEYTLARIHAHMCDSVEEAGGKIDAIFYCPHHPDENCDCRKPKTAMLRQLEREFNLSVSGAYYVGDSFKDLQAGLAMGCKPVLVKTGKGPQTVHELQSRNDSQMNAIPIVDNLQAALDIILPASG